MKDLRSLLAGVCDDREREKCENEFGDNMGWACDNCPKGRSGEIGEYTRKLLINRLLKSAGYPLKSNDLTFAEWLDLGMIEEWLQTKGQ